jgi:hypothetical protein
MMGLREGICERFKEAGRWEDFGFIVVYDTKDELLISF